MKILWRITRFLCLFCLILIVFRGGVYRQLVSYKSVGNRTVYSVSDTALAAYLEDFWHKSKPHDMEGCIATALAATTQRLRFTASSNHNDPNVLIYSKTAHCVGYAAFFSTTCNYFFAKNNAAQRWRATPQIGKIYLCDYNLHQYFRSPFFKDHDFVYIQDDDTGKIVAIDPTVSDYLWVNSVRVIR